VAGVTLWLKKRLSGAFASRQTRADDRLSPGAKLTIASLTLLFPLVAMSLVIVWLIDRVIGRVLQNIESIKRG
jgi:uncharacterized iron-regulated membrane protein